LFCDLEADRLAGLALAYDRSRTRVTIRSDIVDFEGDEIAAPSLLSMGRLNRARSRIFPSNCNLALIDHTYLGVKGDLGPMNLPLFHARKGFGGEDGADGMIVLQERGKIIMPPKLPSRRVTPRARARCEPRRG
jgi:hypothetical protein